jgi:hypothetical protein
MAIRVIISVHADKAMYENTRNQSTYRQDNVQKYTKSEINTDKETY